MEYQEILNVFNINKILPQVYSLTVFFIFYEFYWNCSTAEVGICDILFVSQQVNHVNIYFYYKYVHIQVSFLFSDRNLKST